MSDLDPDLNMAVMDDNFHIDGNTPCWRDQLNNSVNGRHKVEAHLTRTTGGTLSGPLLLFISRINNARNTSDSVMWRNPRGKYDCTDETLSVDGIELREYTLAKKSLNKLHISTVLVAVFSLRYIVEGSDDMLRLDLTKDQKCFGFVFRSFWISARYRL